jgi:chromate transporter
MSKVQEVFKYFSKLGFIAFGGPAAHVAMMQDDLVEKKKWLSSEEFLDYMGATNLIPGPNSTEMTMHCGYHRAGVKGLFVGGMSFILPAVFITLLVAVFFEQIASYAWATPIINGIKAAVISFIIGAIYKLGKKAVKNIEHIIIAIAVIAASFCGINEIICILTAGIIYMIFRLSYKNTMMFSIAPIPLMFLSLSSYTHLKLLFVFLKVGLVLFGSGYVLFAYLDGELIDSLGWITHDDLVEAIAIGQMTPGPVLSTATFIGYKVGGFGGAALATLGIFIPSFFYVWGLNRFIHKMKGNKKLSYFLQAVNVAAVAVMLVVCLKMGQSILIDWKTWLICILSFAAYFGIKGLNTAWIIAGGALLGFLLSYV